MHYIYENSNNHALSLGLINNFIKTTQWCDQFVLTRGECGV